MNSVIVGMFDTQAAATKAQTQLLSAGFDADSVMLTGRTDAGGTGGSTSTTGSTMSNVGSSVSSGAEHAEGAISRFFHNLFGSDDDENDVRTGYADTYNEAFRRGAYGVSVNVASDADIDRAERILNDAGAVDIDEKAASWRQEGWKGSAGAMATGATAAAASTATGATQKLQEVEEELKVGKRAVARGGLRVFKRLVETPVAESVRLREEHATIERRTVDRPATEADFAAFKEGSIEVRETGEEAVVSKTARVTGEVEIGKTVTEREEVVRDTVRKTTVDVEQIEGSTRTAGTTGTTGTSSDTYSTGKKP